VIHKGAVDGTIRVAFDKADEVLLGESSSSSVPGIHASVGHELARYLGLRFAPISYSTRRKLLRGAVSREWDVAFLAMDPTAESMVEFTPAYAEIEITYLIPATGSIRSVPDADERGIRIGVSRNTPGDLHLTSELRHARLFRYFSDNAAASQLKRGELDAVAELMEGYWVLMDPIFAAPWAIAVPRGDDTSLARARAFVKLLRTSSVIERTIERCRLHGVRVAVD
jgi:polar amino acid transport system substrate-binding protein